jgi:DNA-binding transcriptional LysR family regulator
MTESSNFYAFDEIQPGVLQLTIVNAGKANVLILQLSRDNVGIALVPERVVQNTMPADSCAIVAIAEDWAERNLKIVAHNMANASHFTRTLIDHLLLSNEHS